MSFVSTPFAQYTGIMETIRIRRQGYSHRIPFTDFVRRYAFLAFSYDEIVVPTRETTQTLLLRLNMDGWALGKTKVFLKYYHIEFLARIYDQQLRKIVKVQSFVRRWLAKRTYRRELLFKSAAENSGLAMQKRGWMMGGRKRGTDIQTPDDRVKAANRQNSPDFSHPPPVGPVSGPQKHEKNNNNVPANSGVGNKNKNKSQSPAKAAILIQKCVRGYLTRKKVKAIHYRVSQPQKDESQNNHNPKFLAARMQLYQGHKSEDAVRDAGRPVTAFPVTSSNRSSFNFNNNNNNNNNNNKSRIPLPVIT